MSRGHLLLLIALAASAPLSAGAEVRETSEIKTYEIHGNVAADARADMNARRPNGYDARTNWHVKWHYTYKQQNGRCAIDGVTTQLAITYHLPHLATERPALRQSFDAYLARLKIHEDGHADNGRTVARQIDTAIMQLPSAETCQSLSATANALGFGIIKQGNTLDIEYDLKTGHGRTQGARWP